MKDSELIGKVHDSVYQQIYRRGYAAPVDVLMDVGVLERKKYEDWRHGKVPYLEAVCTCNLRQLSFIMKQIRACSTNAGYKPSFCFYKPWGVQHKKGQKKSARQLRFSKSSNPEIERAYATHYVDSTRVNELKEENLAAKIGS